MPGPSAAGGEEPGGGHAPGVLDRTDQDFFSGRPVTGARYDLSASDHGGDV